MDTLNKFIAGGFALVALYLVLQGKDNSAAMKEIFSGFSNVFATLQGRTISTQ